MSNRFVLCGLRIDSVETWVKIGPRVSGLSEDATRRDSPSDETVQTRSRVIAGIMMQRSLSAHVIN